MGKYFGTDGIRGIANDTLRPELAFGAGRAAAAALALSGRTRPRVLICKDTRASSDMLEAALTAGLCSAGADVSPLGVLPTPAAAYLTRQTGADMGIVVSASHNPYEHNGIKMFNESGFKLPDALEERIEGLIDCPEEAISASGGRVGRVIRERDAGRRYADHLVSLAGGGLDRLRVAVDCSNGAASFTAERIFKRLGVDVTLTANAPDGMNINEGCGSTHIEALRGVVRGGRFDVGFAFDGDADRCLAVDERGALIDGDMIMAICARAMKDAGRLRSDAVVGTVMTNSGVIEYARERGIGFFSAEVGDKYVLETMLANGCVLGGESSGHTIFLDDATTGDGQLTALRFLGVMAGSRAAASELRREVPVYPLVLLNAAVEGGNGAKDAIMSDQRLIDAVRNEERGLRGAGRILVRPSGTEPLVRVTVEAKDGKTAEGIAKRLVDLIDSLCAAR
ncbi:MAG: phosphoglucosamine mutase [Oscillospiraceae bacterium]|jgi:phosphoglucosamine mutase|nr:phosphoglucosamine mutase [Oscillospiraceae bacterium]